MDKNLKNQGSDNRSQNFTVPKDQRVKENTTFNNQPSQGVDHSGVGGGPSIRRNDVNADQSDN